MPKMFLNLNQDYSNIKPGTSGEYLIFILRSPDFTIAYSGAYLPNALIGLAPTWNIDYNLCKQR